MDLLQHYTSRVGLEGIARSKALWATDFLELNDKSEMIYAYIEGAKAAGQNAWNQLNKAVKSKFPGFNPKMSYDPEKQFEPLCKHFEECFTKHGASHLYVMSFVAPSEPHQVQLGVLTMWHKYTNNEGYCLVFDRGEVENLLRLERENFDYQSLDLLPVRYGFDPRAEPDLTFQATQRMLGVVELPFIKLVDRRKWWPEIVYARELVRSCARYKSPFWEDEREIRIAAIPTEKNWPSLERQRKHAQVSPGGKHYLELGTVAGGIEPIQVIVGPRANQDLTSVLGLFRRAPEVVRPNFPLR